MKGICTHLWDSKDVRKELEQIKAQGYDCIRQDLFWNVTNPAFGKYNFLQYDLIADACHELGLSVVWVLCFGNNYLDGTADDKTPPLEGKLLRAWQQWISIVDERYAYVAHGWEIWCEPNRSWAWKPHPSLEDYTEFVHATAHYLRGKIYVGALSNKEGTDKFDWLWVDALSKECRMFGWNLSLHPYKGSLYERLADTMRIQTNIVGPGVDAEMRVAWTENGWSKAWGGDQKAEVQKIEHVCSQNGIELWTYCWDNPKAVGSVETGFGVKPVGSAV